MSVSPLTFDALLAELQEIFRDILDQPELVVTPESNAQSVYGWDSLTHVVLAVSIANRFQVKFALGEMKSLHNAGDLARELQRKLAERAP